MKFSPQLIIVATLFTLLVIMVMAFSNQKILLRTFQFLSLLFLIGSAFLLFTEYAAFQRRGIKKGAIGNLKESTPLTSFIQLISFRKGRFKAISITARKLAVIIWSKMVKGTPYINPEGYLLLDQKRNLGLIKRTKKQIDKFSLTEDGLGF